MMMRIALYRKSKLTLMEIDGKKTYLVAAIALIYAASGWYLGFLTQQGVMHFLTLGLGLAGLRHGIAKYE